MGGQKDTRKFDSVRQRQLAIGKLNLQVLRCVYALYADMEDGLNNGTTD